MQLGVRALAFQAHQQHAVQMRLTPELRKALLAAQASGSPTSIRVDGAQKLTVLVDGQAFPYAATPQENTELLEVPNAPGAQCRSIAHVVQKAQALSKRASGHLAPGTGAGRLPGSGVQAPPAPPQRQAHSPAPTAAQRHALSPAPVPRNSQTPPPAKAPAGDRMRPLSTTPQPQSGDAVHARQQGEQQRTLLQQQQAAKIRAKAGRGSAASHGLPPEAMRLLQAAAREHGLRPVLTMLLLMAPNGCSKYTAEAALKEVQKSVAGFKAPQGKDLSTALRQYAEVAQGGRWNLKQEIRGAAEQEKERLEAALAGTKPRNPSKKRSAERSPLGRPQGTPPPGVAALEEAPRSVPAGRVRQPSRRTGDAVEPQRKKRKLQRARPSPAASAREPSLPASLRDDSPAQAAAPRRQRIEEEPEDQNLGASRPAAPAPELGAAATESQSPPGSAALRQQPTQSRSPSEAATGTHRGDHHLQPRLQQQQPEGRPHPAQNGVANGLDAAGRRSSWSSGSDLYDDSWFADHVEREPVLQTSIASLHQFRECHDAYQTKQEVYFQLHQSMQGVMIKMEGMYKAAHDCSHTAAELQTHRDDFLRFWSKRRLTFKRWDKAFKVLHTELDSLRKQMKAFLDTDSVEH